MTYLLVRHEVEDYDEWKANFDDETEDRRERGSEGGRIFHMTEDANELFVLSEWDSVEDAKNYAKSSASAKKIEKAGIAGEVEVVALEEDTEFDA